MHVTFFNSYIKFIKTGFTFQVCMYICAKLVNNNSLSTSYYFFNYLHSWERASICRFQCWVPNKGTTGTIFIMSLVWRGPWLGIKPGTSRFRRQHATTLKHLLVHCSTGFALCFSESLKKVTIPKIPKLTTKDWSTVYFKEKPYKN